MTGKQRNIIIGALIVVLGALAFYFFYWIKTPQYSLNLIRDAVKNHNTEAFERHVDLDSLLNKGYDDAVAYYLKNEGKDLGGMQALTAGVAQMMKPSMIATWKSDVLNSVSGTKEQNTEKKPEPSNQKQNINGAVSAMDRIASKNTEMKGISVIAKESDVATVAISLYNKDLEKNLDVKIKMNKLDNGQWRVKEVTNLVQLLEEIKKAEIAKAKAEDKISREKIYKIVNIKLKDAHIEKSGDYFPTYKLITTVDIPNTSENDVKNVLPLIQYYDENGNFLLNVTYNKPIDIIEKNHYCHSVTTTTLNQFKDADKKVINCDLNKAIILLFVMSLETADGTKLERSKENYNAEFQADWIKEIIEKRKAEKK